MSSSTTTTRVAAGHAAMTAPTGPCAMPCRTLTATVEPIPKASAHLASVGADWPRRAESSITIEATKTRPSIVNGIKLAVTPV
jgi:hypothetical protein